jgi:hypothetical protein
MPRKKKYQATNLRAKKKDGYFKTPVAPSERSETSKSSSTISSILCSETASVTTRSQTRRNIDVATQMVLPDYQPIDIAAWTQESMLESNYEEPSNFTSKDSLRS